MEEKQSPCPVCNRVGSKALPVGENTLWECSHVDCPNRRRITAGPSDGLSRDSDFNLTSHFTPKDIES